MGFTKYYGSYVHIMLAEEVHEPVAILVVLLLEVLAGLRLDTYQNIINKGGCYIRHIFQQIIHHLLELLGCIH